LATKTHFQRANMTQIVARLMVAELPFFGIRDVQDVATCLNGYDLTTFPRATNWSFTRFFMPEAVDAGYRLIEDAHQLWETFEIIHNKAGFSFPLEIPMESFARAVEIVLKESELRDSPIYRPSPEIWAEAVHSCAYVQARMATSRIVSELPEAA
jgi:hypothetical protein